MKFGEISEFFYENFNGWNPGVKPEEVPDDIRELARRVIRRIDEHSRKANWSPFFLYLADEPQGDSPNMWKSQFMYRLVREVAPEMKTAGTVYTLPDWKQLDGLLDLNIVAFVYACQSASANDRYREAARRNNALLYGIDFMGSFDTFWQGREMTMICEKGRLDGIRNWIQWFGEDAETDFELHPHRFLDRRWKGGPYVLRLQDGRVVRSMVWLGIREGIDDSRYLRTVRALIDKANQSENQKHLAAAVAAASQVEKIMGRIPWVGEYRPEITRAVNPNWTNAHADRVRRDLAKIAKTLHEILDESDNSLTP